MALVEQPYRVAGRRSPPPAWQLDVVWMEVVEGLRTPAGFTRPRWSSGDAPPARGWRVAHPAQPAPPVFCASRFPSSHPRASDPSRARVACRSSTPCRCRRSWFRVSGIPSVSPRNLPGGPFASCRTTTACAKALQPQRRSSGRGWSGSSRNRLRRRASPDEERRDGDSTPCAFWVGAIEIVAVSRAVPAASGEGAGRTPSRTRVGRCPFVRSLFVSGATIPLRRKR